MRWLFRIIGVLPILLVLNAVAAETRGIDEEKREAYLSVAEKLIDMGMYEQAMKVLLDARKLDPSQMETHELLTRVLNELAEDRGEVGRPKPISKEDLEKLIREVDFTDAQLKEVVNYLSERCEINIVLSREATESIHPEPVPAAEWEKTGVVPGDPNVEEAPGRDLGGITIRLKDVPLKAVLKYILRMKGLTYVVEEYAIVIVPRGFKPDEEMKTEVYRLYHPTEGMSYGRESGF